MRVEIGAVGVAPLARCLFTGDVGTVAVVDKVVAEDEHAGPLVPRPLGRRCTSGLHASSCNIDRSCQYVRACTLEEHEERDKIEVM